MSKENKAPPEAPAEGAGGREEIARIIDPAAFLFAADELMKGDPSQFNALSKADRILALRARSSAPEAREVLERIREMDFKAIYGEANYQKLADDISALTPRHEAPAEDDDGPCTCCDDTGITIQTERPCACAAGIPFEAPAEGAGEAIARIEYELERAEQYESLSATIRLDDIRAALEALRARSSAPEARAGDQP